MCSRLLPDRRVRRAVAVAWCTAAGVLWCAPAAPASYVGTLDPSYGSGGALIAQVVPGIANIADSLAL